MSFGRGYIESMPLRDALNRLFEDSFVRSGRQQRAAGENQIVPVNMFRSTENVVVFAPMPGLQPEDVSITVQDNVLTMHGAKRGNEERNDLIRHEWTVGPYHRDLELPEDVDVNSARASLDNGVLVVTFSKSERSKPRRIEIRTGGGQGST